MDSKGNGSAKYMVVSAFHRSLADLETILLGRDLLWALVSRGSCILLVLVSSFSFYLDYIDIYFIIKIIINQKLNYFIIFITTNIILTI